MKQEDFIENQYYCCLSYDNNELKYTLYFKYLNTISYDDERINVFCYTRNDDYIGDETIFDLVEYSSSYYYIFKEANFIDFVNLLPNDNIEKISYLRKENIKKLMKL